MSNERKIGEDEIPFEKVIKWMRRFVNNVVYHYNV